MSMSTIAARAAALLLTSEKGRKGIGFLLVAIFAPVILIAAILCSTTSGGADHNNLAVEASFYGTSFTDSVPAEFQTHITDMQTAFALLDQAVAEANATMTDGNRLDPIQVKAIFYALCFGEAAPSQRAADRFVDCFFITEQRTRIVVTELEDGSTVYSFTNGLLFTVTPEETQDNGASVCFSAGKWRSPLGAYYFTKCTASRGESGWEYSVGAEMIS